MNRIKRTLAGVGASIALALPLAATAAPADAAIINNRVKMTGGYGYVVVYGKEHGHWVRQRLWSGDRSRRTIDVRHMYAVGEGRCSGSLWWDRAPHLDRNFGGHWVRVTQNRVTVYVRPGEC